LINNTIEETTNINHTKSGMRASVMSLHRIKTMAAITLITLAVVPMPVRMMLRMQ
jgi:hypothetical protein